MRCAVEGRNAAGETVWTVVVHADSPTEALHTAVQRAKKGGGIPLQPWPTKGITLHPRKAEPEDETLGPTSTDFEFDATPVTADERALMAKLRKEGKAR